MSAAESKARGLAVELARLAFDHNCQDVVALDLRGISSVMDITVIATGTSDRQMRAVADKMVAHGRQIGERPYGISGYEHCVWICVDFVDVVVHLFAGPHREYYDLEMLWGDAPRVDWRRSESA
jgi:ribosome-associated protein